LAKLPCRYDQKDSKENETVGDKKPVVEVPYPKKLSIKEEADDTGQHEQTPEYTGSPAKVITIFSHDSKFW
jgi:hypothetical protein